MGTNYYYVPKAPCGTCQREFERRHIGKSSAGWVFALHVYPDESIHDLDQWLGLFNEPNSAIYDEYNQRLTPVQMLNVIMNRYRLGDKEHRTIEFMRENYAIEGPNGLLRANPAVRGDDVIGPGLGNWDRRVGEFS